MINFEKVKKYCNEDISLIENYDKAVADSTQTWHCHHRRELETSRKELIKNNQYYNRPAIELIFLTHSEHKSLHNKRKYVSSETRKKISIANKGKHLSEEAKRKLSEARRGIKRKPFTEEHKLKIATAIKGRHWFNNGIITVQAKSCPEGFVRGRIKLKKHE